MSSVRARSVRVLLSEASSLTARERLAPDETALAGLRYPYFLKAAFSTAGQGVSLVSGDHERRQALVRLGR
ncbi:MAG: hypothetical protein ACLQI7_07055 [Streptosporangiaceae bacterium]|jgi:hypothetical protein